MFVTRLHVRYDRKNFPEVLKFQETGNRRNFQGRYVIWHLWRREADCDTTACLRQLRERQECEAQELANLNGWDVDEFREKICFAKVAGAVETTEPWWMRLWRR